MRRWLDRLKRGEKPHERAPIITHAIIDMDTSRSFHVPAPELDVLPEHVPTREDMGNVMDVSGGRVFRVDRATIDRWFRAAVARSKRGGSAVYTDVRFSRADVERLWPRRET